MAEKWKEIPGYSGIYSVSDYGRVRMNGREVPCRHAVSGAWYMRPVRPRILALIDHGNGYLYVTLHRDDGSKKNQYVHRLVAEAFTPNPEQLPVVDHLDGDKKNNSAANLEWVTQKENLNRARHLMHKPRPNSKPTNTGEKYIRERNGRYVFSYRGKQKVFSTMAEALACREVMTGG